MRNEVCSALGGSDRNKSGLGSWRRRQLRPAAYLGLSVPVYAFILREPGREDERLLSDVNGVDTGDKMTIRGRVWRVVATESSEDSEIRERKVLMPKQTQVGTQEPRLESATHLLIPRKTSRR